MTHVFIVGSKGIPAQYGGFETFVENLTAGKQSKNLKYHVSCMDNQIKVYGSIMCTDFYQKLQQKVNWIHSI